MPVQVLHYDTMRLPNQHANYFESEPRPPRTSEAPLHFWHNNGKACFSVASAMAIRDLVTRAAPVADDLLKPPLRGLVHELPPKVAAGKGLAKPVDYFDVALMARFADISGAVDHGGEPKDPPPLEDRMTPPDGEGLEFREPARILRDFPAAIDGGKVKHFARRSVGSLPGVGPRAAYPGSGATGLMTPTPSRRVVLSIAYYRTQLGPDGNLVTKGGVPVLFSLDKAHAVVVQGVANGTLFGQFVSALKIYDPAGPRADDGQILVSGEQHVKSAPRSFGCSKFVQLVSFDEPTYLVSEAGGINDEKENATSATVAEDARYGHPLMLARFGFTDTVSQTSQILPVVHAVTVFEIAKDSEPLASEQMKGSDSDAQQSLMGPFGFLNVNTGELVGTTPKPGAPSPAPDPTRRRSRRRRPRQDRQDRGVDPNRGPGPIPRPPGKE